MLWLYVFLSVLSLGLSINVLRPVYHHPKWIVYSFLAGWLVGELALHVIAVQVVLVLLFIWGGVVDGFVAALASLAFIASWLMLAYHYFSGYKAKGLMDSIVLPHRQAQEVSDWQRHDELDVARLTRPFSSWHDPAVEVLKNIVYHEVDGLALKLDIRRPLPAPQQAPVLLQIHGGAWTHGYGSKNEQAIPLMTEAAKRGWVCVAINYRLSPKATFPDHIIDCKQALVWVKAHIAEYGGNPDFVVVTGGSAGGHLSALMALTANLPALQPGFEDADTQVHGCVPYYGIYDLHNAEKLQRSLGLEIVLRKSIIKQRKHENPDLYSLMSPVSHVHRDAPPFLIIHGDKDSLTSLGEAQWFASRLDEVSQQSVEFAEVAGGQHAFDLFSSLRSDYVMLGVMERMQQWYAQWLKAEKNGQDAEK